MTSLPSPPRSALIVGAGMAGAATAWWLARAGVEVTIVEREPGPGQHSTGKNAAILRSAIAAGPTRSLAQETRGFLQSPPAGFSEVPLLDPCGLLVLEGEDLDAAPPAWAAELLESGACERVTLERAQELAPHVRPAGARAFWFAGEGRIDTAALLDSFLRGARVAGARVLYGMDVRRLLREDGLHVRGIELADGSRLEADSTIVAAGGWAMQLAAGAGLELPLRCTRRHLLVSAPERGIDPGLPVVWDDHAGFYVRPESGGLLLCGCDVSEVDPDELSGDEAARITVLEKAHALLRGLPEPRAAHFWPGLRTLSGDDVPIVGHDPRAPGLAWAAGLGGHGMSISAGLGRVACEALLDPAAMPEELGIQRLLVEAAGARPGV